MNCILCGGEFEGRSDARFCSDRCRMRLKRTDGGDKANIEDGIVRDKVIDIDVACQVVRDNVRDKGYIDIEKDLKLDLHKDLGITSWTENGIFIRPDITVRQVQNIARLIHAKHGRVGMFNEAVL